MTFSTEDSYEMHAIVKGRVQGVGFRATTHYHAKQLGLTGTVRNLSNGTVEIYAQGTKARLEKLIHNIQQEMGAQFRIEAEIVYLPIKQTYENFKIIY